MDDEKTPAPNNKRKYSEFLRSQHQYTLRSRKRNNQDDAKISSDDDEATGSDSDIDEKEALLSNIKYLTIHSPPQTLFKRPAWKDRQASKKNQRRLLLRRT